VVVVVVGKICITVGSNISVNESGECLETRTTAPTKRRPASCEKQRNEFMRRETAWRDQQLKLVVVVVARSDGARLQYDEHDRDAHKE
jgi:hypothetical protein